MNDLVLHPVTRRQLEDFSDTPAHAVLLAGPAGSGKQTLAVSLSETIIGLPAGSFATYPYKMMITSDEGKAIGIEAVRQIEHFLSLKVPGAAQATHNRAIIIENAHLLSNEAQNALLKTLEEPPPDTFIILTADNEKALLPTIRSRTQSISIKRPGQAAVEAYFGTSTDAQAIKQAYAVSGGLPGLMAALLDQTDHPLAQATKYARQILSQPPYGRLLIVDELSKQRQLAIDTARILQQMASVSLPTASGRTADKWQAVLVAGYEAAEALAASAQPKLALINLMLGF
jgi:hypothetical protein